LVLLSRPVALPSSGSRRPYGYIVERERQRAQDSWAGGNYIKTTTRSETVKLL
jgi:hypothetical protein